MGGKAQTAPCCVRKSRSLKINCSYLRQDRLGEIGDQPFRFRASEQPSPSTSLSDAPFETSSTGRDLRWLELAGQGPWHIPIRRRHCQGTPQ